jgi:hypothetical protein
MSSLLHPISQDTDAIGLHHKYGMNCYQNAIGFEPITIHFNKSTQTLNYLTLCPGDMAKKVFQKNGTLPTNIVPHYEIKKLVIESCHEDGLEELEERNLNAITRIPSDRKLIALFFSSERCDFDFHVFDEKNACWRNKTPFANETTTTELPKWFAGGYVLSRFFTASKTTDTPRGVPEGERFQYPNGITLNIPDRKHPWEYGAILNLQEDGARLTKDKRLYPIPDLSFSS